MGWPKPRHLPGNSDHAEVVSEGLLDCSGFSVPVIVFGKFNFTTFSSYGDCHFMLERSFNGTDSFVEFVPTKKMELNRTYIINEPERGVYWRFRAVRLFNGVIRYRISQ